MNAQLGTRIKKAFGIELDALKLTQVNFEKYIDVRTRLVLCIS